MNPLNKTVNVEHLSHNFDDFSVINKTITTLTSEEKNIPENFLNIPPAKVKQEIENKITETDLIETPLQGKNLFGKVLDALDKLKEKLGGSRHFVGSPNINKEDNQKTFLGIPMAAVKDWLRMTLDKKWNPAPFWKGIAKLFDVTRDNSFSQYEEAFVSIQRFELLIANKNRFFEILDFQQEDRYGELSAITGLAWHPRLNGSGTEKMYIEFIEKFLTEYFEDAKQKGEEALLE